MNSYVLRRRQIIPADLETVFRFFESPRNLEEITPPWLRFEVTFTSDERMRQGTEIEYRLSWQRMPMTWRSRISEYEPGVMFADEMIRGPYKRWYHLHFFRRVEDGIEMEDVVDYELPFGSMGRIAHGTIVRTQLDAIFAFRRRAIAARFGDVAQARPVDRQSDVAPPDDLSSARPSAPGRDRPRPPLP